MKRCVTAGLIALLTLSMHGGTARTVFAAHVPVALDVPVLWAGMPGSGYLNFVEPGPVPLGSSGTEEYTGWVDNPAGPFGATGATVDEIFGGGAAFDNGVTYGDRADFDFVVENRPVELGAVIPPFPVLHPGTAGYLTWEVAATAPSAHIDPKTGLAHSAPHGPLSLALPDYAPPTFGGVDVFSVIADPVKPAAGGGLVVTDPFGLVSDAEVLARDAALDYVVDFGDIATGIVVMGVPVMVFAPGWTAAAVADDYVTRWVPLAPPLGFAATHVMIDPTAGDPTHPEDIVQIDAVVAFQQIPEPSTLLLAALGAVGLFIRRRRHA